MEEELAMSTGIIMQEETKLNKLKQNLLMQKITNLISSGDDNISYKKTAEKISKKLLEEVGTDRTTERPINIVENNIKRLEIKKQELEESKTKMQNLNEISKKIKQEQTNKEKEIEIIKEIKRKKEETNIEEEIIKINEKSLEEIKNKKNQIKEEPIPEEKRSKTPILITTTLILFILAICLYNNSKIITYGLIAVSIIILMYTIITTNKAKKIKNKKQEKINKANKEKELLENLIQEKEQEISNLQNKKEEKINIQKIEIENKHNIEKRKIEDYFACTLKEIENILEIKEKEIKEINLKMSEIEIENRNTIPKLEEIVEIEEELKNMKERKENLIHLSNSIQIAKQTLDEAYEEMKNKVTPEFTKDLAKMTQKISMRKI